MSVERTPYGGLMLRLRHTSWLLTLATQHVGLAWQRCGQFTYQTPAGDRGTVWHVGPIAVARMEFPSLYGAEAYS